MRQIQTEEELIARMTEPSAEVRKSIAQIQDGIMILGAAGKMGPTLAKLLLRAGAKRVIGVSRFSDSKQRQYLNSVGVETIQSDLMNDAVLPTLPEVEHIFLLAGYKFGSTGNEPLLWAMNVLLPAKVMRRFPRSKIVYVSSGNVYRFCEISSGGSKETDPLDPIGEYAQSRLGGERVVQYYSERNGTRVAIFRLFYATELRYGIILDVAQKILARKPIDLAMGYVNQIWQGDANSYLAMSFPLCQSPARVLNLTGPEILSVRQLAQQLGKLLGIEPLLQGHEEQTALLGNAGELFERLGFPATPVSQIVQWVTHWVKLGNLTLNKPTKFESRTGKF